MRLKIDNKNYQIYKQVFEILCKHLHKDLIGILPPDVHPIAVLNRWEIKNLTLAKRGLKEGLRDLLLNARDFPQATIALLNADLKKNNLPNINILTGLVSDSIGRVLKSKKIQNIDQYYIVKELLDDTVSNISETERRDLSKYLGEFETKTTNR